MAKRNKFNCIFSKQSYSPLVSSLE